jgi:hypothetical protein
MSLLDNYGEWEDDIEDDGFLDDYPDDDEPVCYLGHVGCYDTHDAERRADEADFLEDLERYGL